MRMRVSILALVVLLAASCGESAFEPDAVVTRANAEASCTLTDSQIVNGGEMGSWTIYTYSCPTWMHAQSLKLEKEQGNTTCTISGEDPWIVKCTTTVSSGATATSVRWSNAEGASCTLTGTGGPVSTPVGTYSYSTYSCPTWMHAASKEHDIESGGMTDCEISGEDPWIVRCETYLGEGS